MVLNTRIQAGPVRLSWKRNPYQYTRCPRELPHATLSPRTNLGDAEPIGSLEDPAQLDGLAANPQLHFFKSRGRARAGPGSGLDVVDVDVHSPCPCVALVHRCRRRKHALF